MIFSILLYFLYSFAYSSQKARSGGTGVLPDLRTIKYLLCSVLPRPQNLGEYKYLGAMVGRTARRFISFFIAS